MADRIPDAGKHRTLFYGFYASRVTACTREREASGLPAEPAPAKKALFAELGAAHQQGVPP